MTAHFSLNNRTTTQQFKLSSVTLTLKSDDRMNSSKPEAGLLDASWSSRSLFCLHKQQTKPMPLFENSIAL
jgi:hypothetical protein